MKKAFTLIELLAVIVILIIVLGISVPMISNNLKEKKEQSKEKIIEMINIAAKGYAIDNNLTYPINVELSNLCGEYLNCPLIDPTNNLEIDGHIEIDINGNAVFVSE